MCACGLLLILQKSICRGVCGISQQPTQIRPFVSFSSASCLCSCLLPHFLVSCLISLSRISSPSFGFLFCFFFLPYFLVSSIVSCLSPPMFPFSSCCMCPFLSWFSVFCACLLSPFLASCLCSTNSQMHLLLLKNTEPAQTISLPKPILASKASHGQNVVQGPILTIVTNRSWGSCSERDAV